jgi:hypothetical protein
MEYLFLYDVCIHEQRVNAYFWDDGGIGKLVADRYY